MPANFLQDLISSLLERGSKFGAVQDPRSIEILCENLLTATGENSIKRLGASILEKYLSLGQEEKLAFFEMLAEKFDVDPVDVQNCATAYQLDRNADNLASLLRVSEPPRQELLRRINHVPHATQALVTMRGDLLDMAHGNEALKRVDLDFSHLFSSWFNRGFLIEKPVSWDSSASVLAKIIQYEAVHAINDWDDLRRRIHPPDRRCFAFFHPAMPNEPLVFVEVALCKGTPNSVQALLEKDRQPINAEDADTAVFYSISNCQKGLSGISFGNSLIKQVATDLARELPQLSNFVTLSPLPGFSKWLNTKNTYVGQQQIDDLNSARAMVLDGQDLTAIEKWSGLLTSLAAVYLYLSRRDDDAPMDAVARFHLNNGASIYDIHAMADISPNGLSSSYGVMVNYHYSLKDVEQFHEDYAASGHVHTSKKIRQQAEALPQLTQLENV